MSTISRHNAKPFPKGDPSLTLVLKIGRVPTHATKASKAGNAESALDCACSLILRVTNITAHSKRGPPSIRCCIIIIICAFSFCVQVGTGSMLTKLKVKAVSRNSESGQSAGPTTDSHLREPCYRASGVVRLALFCWAILPAQEWRPASNLANLEVTRRATDCDIRHFELCKSSKSRRATGDGFTVPSGGNQMISNCVLD